MGEIVNLGKVRETMTCDNCRWEGPYDSCSNEKYIRNMLKVVERSEKNLPCPYFEQKRTI